MIKEILRSPYNLNVKYDKLVKAIKKEYPYFTEVKIIDDVNDLYKKESIVSVDKKNALFYFESKDNNVFILKIKSDKKIETNFFNSLVSKYSKFSEELSKKVNNTKKDYDNNILNEDELILHLKNKHLNFENDKLAKIYLKHTSYYRIREFSTIYRNNNDNYLNEEEIYFSQIRARIDYNKQLSYNLLYVIDTIEISIKTNYAKILSKKSPIDYLNFNWLNDIDNINGIKSIFKKAENYLEEDYYNNYIIKFNEKYNSNRIPIIILVEKITLGDLNKMIMDTKDNIISELASIYGMKTNEFKIALSLIKELRNKSAHGNNIIDIIYENDYNDLTYRLNEVVSLIKIIFDSINDDDIFKTENSKLETAINIINNTLKTIEE